MKTLFGLLLLCGVAVTLVSGKSMRERDQKKSGCDKTYCQLSVFHGVLNSGEFIAFEEMESSAYAALMDFLKKQGPNYRLICVVRALIGGYQYTVQYNGDKMVEIYCALDGTSKVTNQGYISDLDQS